MSGFVNLCDRVDSMPQDHFIMLVFIALLFIFAAGWGKP